MTIGERIDKCIKAKGITQRELAAMTGCTEVSMSRYVNDQRVPHVVILLNIARVLGVSTDYLLGADGDEPT